MKCNLATNRLMQQIANDFKPQFFPNGEILTTAQLAQIGVKIDSRGKTPDVVIYDKKRNWLIIVEAVTSHGPIDQKRRNEIKDLFGKSKIGIVYATAFPDAATYGKYFKSIAWETEVWLADQPEHLIHYNGTRFLGPYEE